ncbi:ribonuclease HI [Fulvivirga sedimenti]|uniref:ribonuclease H n=1 Tax=Fulvivirga sedimenti TaxID=2879465 RepID=A0A9X1KX98_9BACT|nr:ribonuclease HI [Fulvivirga sedimenti]MCA6074012.1 ribonuclease HI [Fulvivirga sedimenti]
MIIMYTDGAAKGNPGPGGYGTVLKAKVNGKLLRRELSGGFRKTTNNRMELLAVIKGLEALRNPNSQVIIYSDSKYVVEAIEKGWVWNWEKKDFAKKANADLWKRLIPLYRKHRVELRWVKGHAGIPENERCDQLAVAAAEEPGLGPDIEYEKSVS